MRAVTLYIPSYNVAATLAPTIEGALAQTYPIAEILVINDGSTDATVEIASRYAGRNVRVVNHAKNRGLAAARNTAFAEAKTELVAALDGDCIAHPEWLATLVAYLEDPTIVAAGGRLIETVLNCTADRFRKCYMNQDWGLSVRRDPQFMYGNNSVMRREAVLAAGGYDERHRTNGEDFAVSQNLAKAGWHTVYDPQATVRHLRSDTTRSVLEGFWRYWRFGYRFHYPVDLPRLLFFVARHFPAHLARMLRRREWSLSTLDVLALDLYLPFYMAWREVGLYREAKAS